MHAIDIATSRVIVIDPGQSVHTAAQLMDKHLVGCLVVVAHEDKAWIPMGMLTDRDVCRLVANDPHAGERLVHSVMSHPPVVCPKGASLHDVVQTMHGSGLRRLPVVDENNALVGIVTANDALNAVSHLLARLGEVLVVEPTLVNRLTELQCASDRRDDRPV